MRVTDPRNRGACCEEDGNVGQEAEDENGGMFDGARLIHMDDLQDQPSDTGYRATGVNSSQVLGLGSDCGPVSRAQDLPGGQTCNRDGTLEGSTRRKRVSASWHAGSMALSYLGEASVDKEVEKSAEDFVTHQNREVEVGYCHCTVILNGIWPVTRRCEAKADHIEGERNRKEFPVCDLARVRSGRGTESLTGKC